LKSLAETFLFQIAEGVGVKVQSQETVNGNSGKMPLLRGYVAFVAFRRIRWKWFAPSVLGWLATGVRSALQAWEKSVGCVRLFECGITKAECGGGSSGFVRFLALVEHGTRKSREPAG